MGFNRRAHETFVFDEDDTDCLRCGSNYVLDSKLIELFLAEHALRELTQREERLHGKVTALQKAIAITSDENTDTTEFENANNQLKEAQAQCPKREWALYLAECRFRLWVKEMYGSLRRDDKWFMREEMVQDCSDRGGCCSRRCGCCEQRHLSTRKKGRGHCTVECGCCISFRGFELPEKTKQEMSKDFETLLKQYRSPHIIHLANCFFCPLEPEPQVKPEPQMSWWQRAFKKGFTHKKG